MRRSRPEMAQFNNLLWTICREVPFAPIKQASLKQETA
jgi:hypothetical protein